MSFSMIQSDIVSQNETTITIEIPPQKSKGKKNEGTVKVYREQVAFE